jgi:hypothetical protein
MAVTPKWNNILLQFLGQLEPHTLPLGVTFQHRPKQTFVPILMQPARRRVYILI